MMVLRERENTLRRKEKQILKSIEKNKTEVDRWKKEVEDTPFYEIDPEMEIRTADGILLELAVKR